MYEQIREDILFVILYTTVTTLSMTASCYLLLRRGNAFAPDITPPVRLRRWTAAFLAVSGLSHVWYMPILFLTSSEAVRLCDLIGGLLDCITFLPLAIAVLLAMLQDRRRPLWPIAVAMAPIAVGEAYYIFCPNDTLLPMLFGYFLLMCISLIIYMVHALRQYGRWLRDNYADLEHKEVWQSFVVLAIILLMFVCYAFTGKGPAYRYAMQATTAVLVCYLVWRVETLSDLNILHTQSAPSAETPNAEAETADIVAETTDNGTEVAVANSLPSVRDNIGPLLQQHCIDTQLYLQHDLTIIQLAKAVGTNRYYLSQYFSNQGITYNAYINDLRINHFIGLYHEAVASHRPFTTKQLVHDSGYRSYSTFTLAFKQRMGKNVTTWMADDSAEQT